MRTAGILLISLAAIGLGAAPASADLHRGVSGCFAWSWVDGNTSVRVYWHNQCSTTHKLKIEYSLSWTDMTYTKVVKGDGRGRKRFQTASIVSITDEGPA